VSTSTDRNSHCFSRWVIGAWLAAAGVMAPLGQQTRAADFPVHDTGDPVANGAALVGAINAAMHTAEEDDRVLLDAGVRYVLTNADASTPNTGLPVINSGISIQGGFNSKGDITTIERQAGSAPFRILLIQPRIEWAKMPGCSGPTPVDIKPTVRLEYLKITNGDASGAGPVDNMGGAIQNEDGQLFLLRSELSGNTAGLGGGIDNYPYLLIFTNYCSATPTKEGKSFLGDVTIQETRVHGNSASDSGGGINNAGGLMRIDHSTVDVNQTGVYGAARVWSCRN